MIKKIDINQVRYILPHFNLMSYRNAGLLQDIDISLLVSLFKSIGARIIVEGGTFTGGTTSILACKFDIIFTIDVDDGVFDKSKTLEGQIPEILPRTQVGSLCRECENVIQLFGDTTNGDDIKRMRNVIATYGKIDGMFVDFSHRYEDVLSDSINALSMVRNGGLIVWHDVKNDPYIGVIKALEYLPITVYHVGGSWIGFCKVGE
jgi:predicted O-methyltransferase YrrM